MKWIYILLTFRNTIRSCSGNISAWRDRRNWHTWALRRRRRRATRRRCWGCWPVWPFRPAKAGASAARVPRRFRPIVPHSSSPVHSEIPSTTPRWTASSSSSSAPTHRDGKFHEIYSAKFHELSWRFVKNRKFLWNFWECNYEAIKCLKILILDFEIHHSKPLTFTRCKYFRLV